MCRINSEAGSFYRSLVVIAGPIAIQNFITAAVSSADVIMLGFVGQTAIAASSLAGQIQFILFLILAGLSSGLIMLTAQYWGKKDIDSIKKLTGIALRISCSAGIIFFIGAFFFPRALMKIFTSEEQLIEVGSVYLKTVSFSYLCLAISQIYQAVLKSTEHVRTVTVINFFALGLNIVLNAVFIFGLFGAPKLGIFGVAIATTTSRIIELIICLFIGLKIKDIHFSPIVIFSRSATLTKDFFRYSLPALGNEFVWGTAFAMYSVILGHLGEDVVAANSVVNVIRNLATIVVFGMSYGGAIILGKQIGAGDLELARRNASRLVRTTIIAGFIASIIMLLLKPVLPYIAELSDSAVPFRNTMLYINALSVFGAAINTVLICGVFRSGGDARFGFIMDTIIMWGISVPLGLISAFILKLPPLVVYFILYLDEFEKMPVIIIHYFRRTWLKNITREKKDIL